MRILHIRFKNLNSLVGEWSIDLTQPEYLSDGLFAITGPTGAGKSTILDAICLGLYGCTPRLERITKSSNDIMSRHTGECFAQITFETQQGRFESTWSQHRARKKPEGELQQPQHKLINITKKQTLAEKLTEVGHEIEAITGLDFERFTRSILLAQGSFAAFLQAKPDERSPILEQITGTHIYSDISIKVHERSSLEAKQLTQLQAGLKSLRLLDQQQEQELNDQLTQAHTTAQALTTEIKTTETALHWRQQLTQLEQDLDHITQAKQRLLAKQTAFEPEQKRLQQALKALELAGDYQPLRLVREQVKALAQQQNELAPQMPAAKTTLEHAQTALEHAQYSWQQAKEAAAAKRPLLNQARELDIKLAHQDSELQRLKNTFATQQAEHASHTQGQAALAKQLSTQQEALDQVVDYLQTHRADETLVSELAGLQQRFKQLQHQQNTLKQQQIEYQQTQATQQQLSQAYEQAEQALAQSAQQTQQISHNLNTTQAQLNQHLQDKTLTAWHHSANTIKEQLQQLEQLHTTFTQRTELEPLFTKLQHTTQQTQTQLEQASQTLELKQAQHTTLELQVQSLTERQGLEERIRSLEQHRAALEDNQPCPLCGALEHPFARGNLPLPSDTAKALKAAKQAQADSNTALQRLQHDIAQLKTNHATQTERADTYQKQLSTLTQRLSELAQSLNLALTDLSHEALTGLINAYTEHYQTTQNRIQASERLEQTLKILSHQLTQAQTQQQTAKDQHQKASFALQANLKALQHTEAQCLTSERQLHSELMEVGKLLLPFELQIEDLERLKATEQLLTTRRNTWIQQAEQKQQLTQKLQQLTQEQATLNERLQTLNAAITDSETQVTEQQTHYSTLRQQRYNLLSEPSVDKIEQQLSHTIDQAENQLHNHQQAQQQAQLILNQLETQLGQLQQKQTDTQTQLAQLEQTFISRLQQSDFDSEAAYQAASLSEAERQQLNQQAKTLELENAELKSKEQEKKLQLVSLEAKQLSHDSISDLQTQYDILQQRQSELLKTIGALQKQLDDHHTIKLEQAKQIESIERQQKEYNRWKTLSDLIGSSDGKKYRNFAQGLTFQIMIHHANHQLRKMSERYLLVHNSTQPLELNVLDTYQAGEIRSTRNLSGGESFLVSLALALGLSHMASQNVRIDSLFLDEGFGTLDQEALETALETLSNLQQEGKLIGIISHVQALQERISTQIRVSPQTGGRSKLIGVGCELKG
ncbi:AAA family ATPase [Thiofilum flexile]|uniref:AAA family ATPase n=1 Tax=Thiofilum flexile TaxID=125627 RepID=UPI00037FD974|nr:AAA family ATPase [Thiofilum flexile]